MSFQDSATDIQVSAAGVLSALLSDGDNQRPATLDLNRIIGIDGGTYHYLIFTTETMFCASVWFSQYGFANGISFTYRESCLGRVWRIQRAWRYV